MRLLSAYSNEILKPLYRLDAIARRGASCDTCGMYDAKVLEHFKNPRNAGEMECADYNVEVTNPVCGDTLQLSAQVMNGRVKVAQFMARGCVSSIASGSVLTERMQGKSPVELKSITPAIISSDLGGLPPATIHAAQLACDALTALLEKISAA
jgi:nitrogen fixation NifU-like protein